VLTNRMCSLLQIECVLYRKKNVFSVGACEEAIGGVRIVLRKRPCGSQTLTGITLSRYRS